MILSAAEQRQLVVDHLPFARNIAKRVLSRIPRDTVTLDDLLQEASIGLIGAASRYDPDLVSEGRDFKAFAYQRVLGAVLDSIRVRDRMKRDFRQLRKRIQAAQASMQARGIEPTEERVAAALGLPLERLQQSERGIHAGAAREVDIDECVTLASPQIDFHVMEQQRMLRDAIDRLDPRLRTITLAYLEGWLLRDIAKQLGVTESRICQLLKQAVLILSARLG